MILDTVWEAPQRLQCDPARRYVFLELVREQALFLLVEFRLREDSRIAQGRQFA